LECGEDDYCNDVNFAIELSYIKENLTFDFVDDSLNNTEFDSKFELEYFTVALDLETYFYNVSLRYLDCEVSNLVPIQEFRYAKFKYENVFITNFTRFWFEFYCDAPNLYYPVM
jgi:hypothetical protein